MDHFKKNIFLIVNPASGKMLFKTKLLDTVASFSSGGYAVTVFPTAKSGDAVEAAKTCPSHFDMIVCAGGDGTLNEVISGLMLNEHRFVLGYIPVGTTNDLAASLGLSKTVIGAVKDILRGHTMQIDIGKFGDRYFNYIASFGAFTEASYNAPQEAKNILGHLAYILEGVMSIGNIRPYHIKLSYDDGEIEGDFVFGAISNSTSVGGMLKLSEQVVKMNDGLFEILLIKAPTNVAEFNKIVSNLLKQSYDDTYVRLLHSSKISVCTDDYMDWTLDGEQADGMQCVEIQNIPGAIDLIVPYKKSVKNTDEITTLE